MYLREHGNDLQHTDLDLQGLLRAEILQQSLTHVHPVIVVETGHFNSIICQALDDGTSLCRSDEELYASP